jgi:hypothetical protein
LLGAFINLNASSVANFTIKSPGGYIYPKGLASCMTRLQGRPMYVETGGTEFDATKNEDAVSKGVFVMDAAVSTAQHSLVAAAGGGSAAPGYVHSALACTPDGQLFLFGGLRNGGRKALNPGGDAQTSWQPTNSLTALRLSGSPGSPSVTKDFEVSSSSSSASTQPAARSGQAMAYLPPSVSTSLGLSQGGLVMYGGSNIPATLGDHLLGANSTEAAAKLRGTQWDTATWLFDVAGRKWVQLATQGAGPPGLMYHSMTAAGQQVRQDGWVCAGRECHNRLPTHKSQRQQYMSAWCTADKHLRCLLPAAVVCVCRWWCGVVRPSTPVVHVCGCPA